MQIRNSCDSVTQVEPSFVILTIPTLYTLKDYVKQALASHRDNPSQDIYAADFERSFIQPSLLRESFLGDNSLISPLVARSSGKPSGY